MNEISFTAEENGERLDKFLSLGVPGLSRTAAAHLIESGYCKVNGAAAEKNYKIRSLDEVVLTMPEPESADIVPENIPLDIRYEDGDLLVVNKPRGMVVHPANGVHTGTLVNALMYHRAENLSATATSFGINGVIRPGIVHRIDKDTSGLLLVAKNDFAHNSLAEQLKEHTVTREYEAVVHGNVKQDGICEINAPIGRSVSDRKKMCVTDKNSRGAVTRYSVIAAYARYTRLRLILKTGRTHQIRVHMAYIGHPVAGDGVYGSGKPKWLNGQCLHAGKLGFAHPRSGEYIEIESELPEYFTKFLGQMENV
ncbi:MAG: RluA family pseudouridine synthase [Oscillospiraceae bacterium]|jgi:23S rRNA pseudouridine1911/1915/1917 synthase|nr:RluA family pseudouridine synthase [Oscillospiraceae bacterium]